MEGKCDIRLVVIFFRWEFIAIRREWETEMALFSFVQISLQSTHTHQAHAYLNTQAHTDSSAYSHIKRIQTHQHSIHNLQFIIFIITIKINI